MVEFSFDRPVEPSHLQPLFRDTDWAGKRTPAGIATLLGSTPLKLGAWEGDRLVGFARAMTDGAYRALIDDVVVDPARRGEGIGNRLMEKLLERLAGVEQVLLLCGPEIVPFYERCGFKRGTSAVMVRTRPG